MLPLEAKPKSCPEDCHEFKVLPNQVCVFPSFFSVHIITRPPQK